MQITTIGLDIAKNVFQVHGIDAAEKVVVRKQLRRGSIGKTRKVPREERTRAFVWDPISGSHQGQRPKWLH